MEPCWRTKNFPVWWTCPEVFDFRNAYDRLLRRLRSLAVACVASCCFQCNEWMAPATASSRHQRSPAITRITRATATPLSVTSLPVSYFFLEDNRLDTKIRLPPLDMGGSRDSWTYSFPFPSFPFFPSPHRPCWIKETNKRSQAIARS